MADQRLKDLRGTGRRDFLRWAATVGAAIGLERSRILNVINDTAGTAMADGAACATTRRSIHFVDGNGGLANWTQIFPFPKVIKSTNNNYSHYALGKATAATGYDNEWQFGPDSPWQTGTWKVTAFVAGNAETHTQLVQSTGALGGNQLLASAASIQQANPTLLPVLTVGQIQYGTAPGAPATAAVGAATQLVDLFNSAASRALLNTPESGALAEAYYKAFIGLNAAAGRTTLAKSYGTGKVSMNLLAKNLSAQLTPTAADQALFGITATTPSAVTNAAAALITTIKAFSLGLTSMMAYAGPFRDDPHGAFTNVAQLTQKSQALGKMMQGLYDLSKTLQDPSCTARTLADSIVVTVQGDTYKAPFNSNGWGDNTVNGSNMLYVMGNGYVKTGMIGDIDPAGATAWDPSTGALQGTPGSYQGKGAALGSAAAAAALYAVAKGDMRRVRDFYNGAAIDGVVNLNVTG